MGEYISRLFFVCAASAICDIVCSHSSGKSTSKAVNLVCALCVCITVFSVSLDTDGFSDSISRLASSSTTALPTDVLDEKSTLLIENTKKELGNNISSAIFEKFGINCSNISIDFNTDIKDGITELAVSEISATLDNRASDEMRCSVKEALEEMFGCSVSVN